MEFPELHFEVRTEEEGGFSASCLLPGHGLFTQGDDLEELHANVLEVSLLYLEGLAEEAGTEAPSSARFSLHFAEPAPIAA